MIQKRIGIHLANVACQILSTYIKLETKRLILNFDSLQCLIEWVFFVRVFAIEF